MDSEQSLGWIWMDDSKKNRLVENKVVYFRKTLELKSLPKEMVIDISADAKYKLYVNGVLVNMGPQKGDHKIHYFDRLDVGPHLKMGKNVFLVKVLGIPNQQNQGNHSFHRTDTPGLYVSGFYGEERHSFIADCTWKYFEPTIEMIAENQFFAPLTIFEKTSGRQEEKGMMLASYDDSSWSTVRTYTDFELPAILKPDSMVIRQIPLLFLEAKKMETNCIRQSSLDMSAWNQMFAGKESITIDSNSEEVIEISAGEETTGYLILSMLHGSGASIDILTSECYAYEPREGFGEYTMPVKGDRTDHVNGKLYGFTDTYQVDGYGTDERPEVYETFWFRTFRYIQLRIVTKDQPLTLTNFSYLKTGYPLEIGTSVKTSDDTFESIWDISERTLRLCMHETYEDCPFYEQLQYAMDSRSQILYTYATSADDRLARQCMDDFRRATRHDGMIGCSYPNYESNVIPGFAIYYIGMVYDHMMYFGDKELIRKHLPAILDILNFYRRNINDQGLVKKLGGPLFQSQYWSFIDWTSKWQETIGVPPATNKGPLTMESLLYVMGLQYAAELMDFIGYAAMADELKSETEALQKAINTYCVGGNGMYTDGPGIMDYSQHTQVFAILTDTVDLEQGRRYLEETFVHKEDYAQCSVAMMYYVFRALEKCELYDKTNELWDIWREMVNKNLTTCEEDSVSSRSDCHAWGAVMLYELPSVVLGVRPKKPGFTEIEINPQAGHLEWAGGEVITPLGTVEVRWEKKDDELLVTVSAPEKIKVVPNRRISNFTTRSISSIEE